MEQIKKINVIPADHSPESIRNVMSIVFIDKKKGLGSHSQTTHLSLQGTVEERLAQYKAHTGEDWQGFDEETFTTYEEKKPVSLNLGQATSNRIIPVADVEVQEKIDAMAQEARDWLEENEAAKKRWVAKKEVETLAI